MYVLKTRKWSSGYVVARLVNTLASYHHQHHQRRTY